jgi:acyl-CoA thioester hydrolase
MNRLAPLSATFSWPVRVYYEDTDAGGIVYYANFLKFFERARTEWLRRAGVEQIELAATHHVQFVVAHAAIDYKRPARLDDRLDVDVRIDRLARVFIEFAQAARRAGGGELLASARVKVACLDNRSFQPTPLPSFLLERLQPAARAES